MTEQDRQEFQMARDEEPGLWVTLIWPNDKNVFVAIESGSLTVARVIRRIATRRQFERETTEIERKERKATWREQSV
jgi:hypothetical protein